MIEKEILLIDMDGCIADFVKEILKIKPDVTFLDEHHHIEEQIIDEIVKNDSNFFQRLEPIEGGIEAVKELMNYYDVQFCSTPMEVAPHSYTGKKEWLNNHFGEKAYKNLILTHKKDRCIGHYLIDDRIKNGVENFKGEHIHFDTEKFPNWEVTKKYLIDKYFSRFEDATKKELINAIENSQSFLGGLAMEGGNDIVLTESLQEILKNVLYTNIKLLKSYL